MYVKTTPQGKRGEKIKDRASTPPVNDGCDVGDASEHQVGGAFHFHSTLHDYTSHRSIATISLPFSFSLNKYTYIHT